MREETRGWVGWAGRYHWVPPRLPSVQELEPGVTVVIPTWNGASRLEGCLKALQAQHMRPARVVVVDNACRDDTAQVVSRFPQARLIQRPDNLGYAGALALAFEQVTTHFVAALNDDALPGPGWLAQLVAFLEDHPSVGAVTPLVVRPDGLIDTAGDVLTTAGFAYKRLHRHERFAEASPGILVTPPGVAAVYRVRAVREAGGWDPGLHSHWDDVDLGLRLWRAGWDVSVVPDTTVLHLQGSSWAQRASLREFLASRNQLVVMVKTLPCSLLAHILPHHLLYLCAASASHMARGTWAPFLAGKVAALLSLADILAARRWCPRGRSVRLSMLEKPWWRAWWGLSRLGGRRSPRP